MFDGPADDPNLLGVPGQIIEGRPTATRALSLKEPQQQRLGSLAAGMPSSASVAVPSSQSLANYELTLTVSGDDRRRKSAVDLEALKAVQGDGNRESGGRPLRRAQPLSGQGTEGSLMEKALQQHHLEKAALFRSHSKRSIEAASFGQAPVFNVSFGTSAKSTPGRMPTTMDDLDPLETAIRTEARRSQSMQHLGQSRGSQAPMSRKSNTPWTSHTASATRGRRGSITPLAAWSRFPSHTRERRCGSASREDNVFPQDFAYENDHSSEAIFPETPSTGPRRSKLSVQKGKDWIVKSRSMTFGTVMRYYSNLFTSSVARNRRSSIAMGGRLEHPELEILPPIFPAHPFGLPHRHSSGHIGHFVSHIKEEIKEEGHHLAAEIKEEGHHLKEETNEALAHHPHLHVLQHTSTAGLSASAHDPQTHLHNRTSAESLDPASPKIIDSEPERDSEDDDLEASVPRRIRIGTGLSEDSVGPLDGTINTRVRSVSKVQPDARRLSRMYQAYVQLPVSLDASAGAEDYVQQDTGSPDEESTCQTSLLSVPPQKRGGHDTSGTVVRRYPSVTVVDDRKGHWRSISLISAQSGKSLRNSTNDLLNLIVEAKDTERHRLMESTGNVKELT